MKGNFRSAGGGLVGGDTNKGKKKKTPTRETRERKEKRL